jgi:transcriptional regulator GlxA family with amidase domain
VARPPESKSSAPQPSRGFPPDQYDQLIKYATNYANTAGFSSPAAQRVGRAAEITHLIIRLVKGDVRLRFGTMARKLRVNPRVLRDSFRRLYGPTPKTYQIQVRIEWVRNAIASQPDRKLESIAADVGYSDFADFTHFFYRQTGSSPRQYQRKRQRRPAQFDK